MKHMKLQRTCPKCGKQFDEGGALRWHMYMCDRNSMGTAEKLMVLIVVFSAILSLLSLLAMLVTLIYGLWNGLI